MSGTKTKPTLAAEKPVQWSVLDTNAKDRNLKRYHESGGQLYGLSAYEAEPMPKEHALVFLRDPSFTVRDEAGTIVRTLPKAALAAKGEKLELEANQTIATYDELTNDALLARASLRPGGAVTFGMPREALMEFLSKAPAVLELAPEDRARDTGTPEDPDMMSDEELAKMPGRSADELLMGGG
jgi:hypothetical protein